MDYFYLVSTVVFHDDKDRVRVYFGLYRELSLFMINMIN